MEMEKMSKGGADGGGDPGRALLLAPHSLGGPAHLFSCLCSMQELLASPGCKPPPGVSSLRKGEPRTKTPVLSVMFPSGQTAGKHTKQLIQFCQLTQDLDSLPQTLTKKFMKGGVMQGGSDYVFPASHGAALHFDTQRFTTSLFLRLGDQMSKG